MEKEDSSSSSSALLRKAGLRPAQGQTFLSPGKGKHPGQWAGAAQPAPLAELRGSFCLPVVCT